MQFVNLWEDKVSSEFIEDTTTKINIKEMNKVIEEKKKEKSLPQVTTMVKELEVTVTEDISKIPITFALEESTKKITSKKSNYVIHAMKNKVGKQMYLSSWDDAPEQWCISCIPYITTKHKCQKLIEKANESLSIVSNKSMKLLKEKLHFEIIKIEKEEHKDTHTDIIARANKMLEESKTKRNKK